jgi:NADPH-dependent curcumin reductase CurA
MVKNKTLIFAKIPSGLPIPGQDLIISESEFDLEAPPPAGGFTTQNFYLSFDPFQRGKMRDPAIRHFTPAYPLGGPINNNGIAKVLKSDTARFRPGDAIRGYFNTELYSRIEREAVEGSNSTETAFEILENPLGLPTILYLGALGMSGLTAYSSLYAIGKSKKGDTIFVSVASGAVGQIVGQLAKREGLTAIGSVGSDEKLAFITKELGFDGGFNYKKEKPEEALARLAPQGLNIYYDMAGGEQLDAAIGHMCDFGRIGKLLFVSIRDVSFTNATPVACGQVSQTSVAPGEGYRLKNAGKIVYRRLNIRGFIVFDDDMGPAYAKEHKQNMEKWIHSGEIVTKMDVTNGIDEAAVGLVGMLKGVNFGKAVLKMSDL